MLSALPLIAAAALAGSTAAHSASTWGSHRAHRHVDSSGRLSFYPAHPEDKRHSSGHHHQHHHHGHNWTEASLHGGGPDGHFGDEVEHHDHMECVHHQLLDSFDHETLREQSVAPQQYRVVSEDRETGRRLQTSTYSGIRFAIDSRLDVGEDPTYTCHSTSATYRDTSATSGDTYYPCQEEDVITEEKRRFILDELLPEAMEWLSTALSVMPVEGNLVLSEQAAYPENYCYTPTQWSGFACCRDQMKDEHMTTGVPNADYIMHVTARPWRGTVAAWAFPCQLDQYARPISGQINFVPSQISLDPEKRRSQFIKTLHELFHNLGFSDYFFTLFRSPGDMNRRVEGAVVDRYDSVLGKNLKIFTMDNAVAKMKEHFDCYNWAANTAGVELEDQGTTSTMGKHLEERLFYNELMSGWIHPNSVPSPVSLAFLEDSGWYQVDYSLTEKLVWGNGEGCSFVQRQCSNWDDRYFCQTPRESGCTVDMLSKALCNAADTGSTLPAYYQYFSGEPQKGGTFQGADYCPLYAALSNGQCSSSETARYYFYGEYTGAGSRCFAGTWQLASFNEPRAAHGACLETRCSPVTGLIEATVAPGTADEVVVRCPATGGVVDLAPLSNSWEGTIVCPPSTVLCSGNPCDIQDCSGHGTCQEEDGTCVCEDGYYGDDEYRCDKKQCPLGIDDVPCSGHGECNTGTGRCSDANGLPGCFDGWSMEDCSREGCPVAESEACTGGVEECECAGLGTCVNGKCDCQPGYIAYDCSLTDCPGSPVCSGSSRGTCDQTNGVCECGTGVNQATGTFEFYSGANCSTTNPGRPTFIELDFVGEDDGLGNVTEPWSGALNAKEYVFFTFEVPSIEYDIKLSVTVTNDFADSYFRMPAIVAAYATFGTPTLRAYEFVSTAESARVASITFGSGSGTSSQPSRFNEVGTMRVAVIGLDAAEVEVALSRDGCAVIDCGEHGVCDRSRCICDRPQEREAVGQTYGWTGERCNIPDCPGTPDCNGRAGTCVVDEGAVLPRCECNSIYAGERCQSYRLTTGMDILGASVDSSNNGAGTGVHSYATRGKTITVVNATQQGTVDVGTAQDAVLIDPELLGQCCGINTTSSLFVRMTALSSEGADPMLLTQTNGIASLRDYDQFDRGSWSTGSTTHEIITTIDSSSITAIQVRNGRYATQRLKYELYVEVTQGGCPPALNDCSGHGVGECVTQCVCEPGWEGIRCDIPAPLVSDGSVVSIPRTAPGEWHYYLFDAAGFGSPVAEVELSLTRPQGSSPLAQPLAVASWESSRSASTTDKVTSEAAVFDFDGFTNTGRSVNATNATEGDQHLVIARTVPATQRFLVIGVHNAPFARADVVDATLAVTVRSQESPYACAPGLLSPCCAHRGTLTSVQGRAVCNCDYGWHSGTRCASPQFASFANVVEAAQGVDFLCSLCGADVAMAKDELRFFKVPQPLQKGVGLRMDVFPGNASEAARTDAASAANLAAMGATLANDDASGTSAITAVGIPPSAFAYRARARSLGASSALSRRQQEAQSGAPAVSTTGVPSVLVAATLPRSILDFIYVASSSSTNETVVIEDKSTTGSYFVGVYANTKGVFRVQASREELAYTEKEEEYLISEVTDWLFNTSSGQAAFACCLLLLIVIVGICVIDNCAPRCLANLCMVRDEEAEAREKDMIETARHARRLSRMPTVANLLSRHMGEDLDDDDEPVHSHRTAHLMGASAGQTLPSVGGRAPHVIQHVNPARFHQGSRPAGGRGVPQFHPGSAPLVHGASGMPSPGHLVGYHGR